MSVAVSVAVAVSCYKRRQWHQQVTKFHQKWCWNAAMQTHTQKLSQSGPREATDLQNTSKSDPEIDYF